MNACRRERPPTLKEPLCRGTRNEHGGGASKAGWMWRAVRQPTRTRSGDRHRGRPNGHTVNTRCHVLKLL
jgi:hypothetical protein